MDVGIVIALKEEFREFFNEIKGETTCEIDKQTNIHFYTFARSSNEDTRPYQCVVTFAGQMGHTKAALVTKTMISKWSPEVIVNIGLAGGISSDIRLGDVVVATAVDSYQERSKAGTSTDQQSFDLEFGGEVHRCSNDIVQMVQHFEFAHIDIFQTWLLERTAEFESLIPERIRSRLTASNFIKEYISLQEGHIASGATVGASVNFTKWLKKRDRNYLAIEMEAGGVMSAVFEEVNILRSLVIRGISDFGDERKSKLDKVQGGAFRRYAMRNAMSLLWALLSAGCLPFSTQTQDKESLRNVALNPS